MRTRERLSAMTRWIMALSLAAGVLRRLRGPLIVIGLVAGLAIAPTARVAACDCAMTELPQAIRDAEVAFIGVLAGTDEPLPAPVAGGPPEITWTWQIERSRDPISADRISVTAWQDDGANCGVAFGVDERWLIVGDVADGRLQTNGCMRNQRMDRTDPDGEAIIESLVTHSVAPGEPAEGGAPSVPMPVIVLLAGAAAVALISFMAFRRGAR